MNAAPWRLCFPKRHSLLGLLLFAIGLLASCAGYVEQRAERAIIETLPKAIGPADRYEATVRGSDANATHFNRVRAVGIRVRREHAPVLDRIEADLQDVSVDHQARRVTAIGGANGRLWLRAGDLADYLRQRAWIEEPAVRFDGASQVIVSGRLKLPGLALASESRAELRGVLTPRQAQILMRVESLRYSGTEAPSIMRGIVEQVINPVFDVAKYAVPSQIDAVAVEGDAIIIDVSGSQLFVQAGS
jgi:hypothetical protein